jgi:hypothetical protein
MAFVDRPDALQQQPAGHLLEHEALRPEADGLDDLVGAGIGRQQDDLGIDLFLRSVRA